MFIEVEKLPSANKEQIKEYVKNLDEESLEEFLKKNKISYSESGLSQEGGNIVEEDNEKSTKCIFCSITKGEMPSYKIAENKKSIAILEINPLSKGHVIVLPLEHGGIDKISKQALSLSQKITKKIKKKLKPEDIKIETASFQGHSMINIIPIYKNTPLKKFKATEEELKKLQFRLITKKRASRKKEKKISENIVKKSEDLSKLPTISFRIP